MAAAASWWCSARARLAACILLALACTAVLVRGAAAEAAVTASPRSSSGGGGGAVQLSAEAVVQRQLDAFNAGDLEAYMALLADDCVVSDASTGAVLAQGTEQLRRRYEEKFSTALTSELLGRLILGEVVVDREVVRGPDGRDQDGLLTYRVKGGKIVSIQLLFKPRA